jgi:hypothetical protein
MQPSSREDTKAHETWTTDNESSPNLRLAYPLLALESQAVPPMAPGLTLQQPPLQDILRSLSTGAYQGPNFGMGNQHVAQPAAGDLDIMRARMQMDEYGQALRAIQEHQLREALMNDQLQRSAATLHSANMSDGRSHLGPYQQQHMMNFHPPNVAPLNLTQSLSQLSAYASLRGANPAGGQGQYQSFVQSSHMSDAYTLPPLLPQYNSEGGSSNDSAAAARDRLFPSAAARGSLSLGKAKGRQRSRIADPFPVRLHRLLRDLEADGKQDIASFTPTGNAFRVDKPERFIRDVAPSYFRQKQFSSFKHQLNAYGYTLVIGGGVDVGAFYHPQFQRDNPDLCKDMLPKRAPDIS